MLYIIVYIIIYNNILYINNIYFILLCIILIYIDRCDRFSPQNTIVRSDFFQPQFLLQSMPFASFTSSHFF